MHKLTLFLILAIIWSGCDMTGTADPAVISTIQAEMQIDLANPFESPSQFALRMSTLEEKCANSQILADGAIQGNNVHIAVSGLLVEPDCIGEYDKIQKDVDIPLEQGQYSFSMIIGENLINTGVLSFDGIAYTLKLNTSTGVKLGHSELFKIPEGTIWGSISSDEGLSEIRQEFLSVLNSSVSAAELPGGYYGHFTIEDSNISGISLTDDNVFDFNQLFVYKLDVGTDGLQFILDNFRTKYGDLVEISCTTWTGQSL